MDRDSGSTGDLAQALDGFSPVEELRFQSDFSLFSNDEVTPQGMLRAKPASCNTLATFP
jgi:hypothetical protein